jgi:hypothetical protein
MKALKQLQQAMKKLKIAHCAQENDTQMKRLSGIVSQKSKAEYLVCRRERYPSSSLAGRSAMIDKVSEVLGWELKHTNKVLLSKCRVKGGVAIDARENHRKFSKKSKVTQ